MKATGWKKPKLRNLTLIEVLSIDMTFILYTYYQGSLWHHSDTLRRHPDTPQTMSFSPHFKAPEERVFVDGYLVLGLLYLVFGGAVTNCVIRTPWSPCHSLQHLSLPLRTQPGATQPPLWTSYWGEFLESSWENVSSNKFQARTTIGLVYTPATFFIFFFRTILILYPDRVNMHILDRRICFHNLLMEGRVCCLFSCVLDPFYEV